MRIVQPRLSAIEGIQRAEILGGRTFAMRVWLDPVRMAALGVTAADISESVQRDNFISTTGATEGNLVRATVDALAASGDERVTAGVLDDDLLRASPDLVRRFAVGRAIARPGATTVSEVETEAYPARLADAGIEDLPDEPEDAEEGLRLVGIVAMADPPRESAAMAIAAAVA